jgi:WD40 repeat protein
LFFLASDKDHHVALIHVNEPENPVVWDSTIDEIGPIRSFNVLAVSPDKRIAVQKNWYGKFVLLHLENGREILSAQNPSSQADILDQAFSLDGRLLATADGSGVVGLWDVATMEGVATLEGHRDSAAALVFLPGGERLASGGAEDNAVIVWDLNSRRELLRLQAPGRVVHLRFSEKHQTLIGLTDAGGLYAWRAPME